MSRFWPHTPYAEEQPYSRAILWTHVLTRAVQAGSVVGVGIGTSIFLLQNFKIIKAKIPPSTFAATVLRSTGVGATIATGLMFVALPVRMHDQKDIQWKDRSWRLLENKGQVETDDWTYPSMLLGAVGATTFLKGQGWRAGVGSIGAGSVLGMMGYMGWRYGVHGGKRTEGKAL